MTSGATIEGFKLCVPDFPYSLRAAEPPPWVHLAFNPIFPPALTFQHVSKARRANKCTDSMNLTWDNLLLGSTSGITTT
jgi:hypothetical protein